MAEHTELPPGVCPECYRTNGEHAPDCQFGSQQMEQPVKSEVQGEVMGTGEMIVPGFEKHLDALLKSLNIVTAEEKDLQDAAERAVQSMGYASVTEVPEDQYDQYDQFITKVKNEYFIELGHFARILQGFRVQLSELTESTVRQSMEIGDDNQKAEKNTSFLEKIRKVSERVEEANAQLLQKDTGGLKRTCHQLETDISILEEDINRII